MKDNIQTILNVCFAISITAFIYQNNLQQKRILTLELDLAVHKAWERMDSIEDKIKINYSNFGNK